MLLLYLGRREEAIDEGRRARELDRLALITRTLESILLHYAGRDDEARENLAKKLEIGPNFWIARLTLGKIHLRAGKVAEAIAELSIARQFSGGNTQPTSLMGYARALSGDRAQALAVLNELKTLSMQRYVPPYNIAMVYNGLGEDDEALAWLERAYEAHQVLLTSFINVHPYWEPLHLNPRLVTILKGMKLE